MAYTDIDKPSDYFNTVLYTGNGSTQSISSVGFQPDWVWIKDRDTTDQHFVFDVVRGVYNELNTNATQEEQTKTDTLTSFDTDGYTLSNRAAVNRLNDNFVSWNWLGANASSSNTDGSITSSVSANTDAGFSIVSYTGNGTLSTVGHGLSASPSFYVIKDRDNGTYDWFAYHKSLGATKYLRLSGTDASTTSSTLWNDTEPTSSVFTIGGSFLGGNTSGNTYIAYCFAEKKGYSKIGSYTGNGSSDGSYIHLGFKPALIISKRTDSTGNWNIQDNKRDGFNESDAHNLVANDSRAEETFQDYDFLSSGFKCRTSESGINASGGTYIYMAFAEQPLVGTNNIPCTAR